MSENYEKLGKLMNNNDNKIYSLVLYDDIHKDLSPIIFENCKYTPIQAKQCTQIIRNKGKYAIMIGNMDRLFEPYSKFCSMNFKVELIEKKNNYNED